MVLVGFDVYLYVRFICSLNKTKIVLLIALKILSFIIYAVKEI